MPRPDPVHDEASFDLIGIAQELRQSDTYAKNGHTGRTLVRTDDMRIVLEVVRAGGRIAEHRARETAAIQVMSGRIRLSLPSRTITLSTGALVVLEAGLHHEVEAEEDSAFVLTLGWPSTPGTA